MKKKQKNKKLINLKLKKIFSKTLNIKVNKINSNFSNKKTSEWDSLAHINLINNIEKEFKIKFKLKELSELDSYKKFYLKLSK